MLEKQNGDTSNVVPAAEMTKGGMLKGRREGKGGGWIAKWVHSLAQNAETIIE